MFPCQIDQKLATLLPEQKHLGYNYTKLCIHVFIIHHYNQYNHLTINTISLMHDRISEYRIFELLDILIQSNSSMPGIF